MLYGYLNKTLKVTMSIGMLTWKGEIPKKLLTAVAAERGRTNLSWG